MVRNWPWAGSMFLASHPNTLCACSLAIHMSGLNMMIMRVLFILKNIHNSTPQNQESQITQNMSRLDLSALVKQNEMLWSSLWKIALRPSRSCDLQYVLLIFSANGETCSLQLLSMLHPCPVTHPNLNLIASAEQACKNKLTESFVYQEVRKKENYVRWQRTTFHTDVVGISSNFMGRICRKLWLRLYIYCKNLKQPHRFKSVYQYFVLTGLSLKDK